MIALNTKTVNLASAIEIDSIVDGEGLRTVIWFQGCPHHCPGCHNPQSHAFNGGKSVDLVEIINILDNLGLQDGITFSGGEPFAQTPALIAIAEEAKKRGLNIWAYTGYKFEELLIVGQQEPEVIKALRLIDVLVDGKFILSQKSLNLKFRGSKNQRILDVKKSLRMHRAVLIQKYRKLK